MFNSQYIDVFQDSTGVTNLTNTARNNVNMLTHQGSGGTDSNYSNVHLYMKIVTQIQQMI